MESTGLVRRRPEFADRVCGHTLTESERWPKVLVFHHLRTRLRTRFGTNPCLVSGPWRLRHEDPAQHRAGELRRQAIHDDLVTIVVAHPMALAPATNLPEPGLLIRPATGKVERVDRQHDVVQTEGGESEVEHQSRGLGAVPLSPIVRLADEDAKLG